MIVIGILIGAAVFTWGLYLGHIVGYAEAKRLYEPYVFQDSKSAVVLFTNDGRMGKGDLCMHIRPAHTMKEEPK